MSIHFSVGIPENGTTFFHTKEPKIDGVYHSHIVDFLVVLENVRDDLKRNGLSKSSSYRHCLNAINDLKKLKSLTFGGNHNQPSLF